MYDISMEIDRISLPALLPVYEDPFRLLHLGREVPTVQAASLHKVQHKGEKKAF